MTTLGKILVILTVAFSLACLGYALAVFGSQRVQTPPAPSGEGTQAAAKPANVHGKEFAERSDTDAKARQELTRARERWNSITRELASVEEAYNSHPDFYRAELAALDDGPGNMKTIATQEGKVQLDNKIHGRVVMVDAKDELDEPIQNYKTYPPLIDEEHRQLALQSKELAGDPLAADPRKKLGLIRWHEHLTKLLYEELENEDPKARGLRVELATEEFKVAQLQKELDDLRESSDRLSVDNSSLADRTGQMKARKQELEAKLKGK